MPSLLTAEQCEQAVKKCLTEIRAQFQQALEAKSETGHIFTALGTELHVDQVRRIATESTGAPGRWVVREDKHTMSTMKDIDQGVLSLYVGGNRFVTAELIFLVLCDIVDEKSPRGAPNIPGFINLLVVEGYLHPERDLPIWLTIARALETGNDRQDLHRILPPLNSDFDILHHELPANVDPSYELHPIAKTSTDSWDLYLLQLMESISPGIQIPEALAVDNAASEAMDSAHLAGLAQYIQQQIFARVAQAIAVADGGWAVLRPF